MALLTVLVIFFVLHKRRGRPDRAVEAPADEVRHGYGGGGSAYHGGNVYAKVAAEGEGGPQELPAQRDLPPVELEGGVVQPRDGGRRELA